MPRQGYSLWGPRDLPLNFSPSIVTLVPETARLQVLMCVKRAAPFPQVSSEAPFPLGWKKREQRCSPIHLGQNLQGLLILTDQQSKTLVSIGNPELSGWPLPPVSSSRGSATVVSLVIAPGSHCFLLWNIFMIL